MDAISKETRQFRGIVTGFLSAILVTLMLQVITPPDLRITSKVDPNSLTGHLVWDTRFELVVIALSFLIGLLLGRAAPKRVKRRLNVPDGAVAPTGADPSV